MRKQLFVLMIALLILSMLCVSLVACNNNTPMIPQYPTRP